MTQIRVLSDGRRIGIAEFGKPHGAPVVALHGTPGSCLKFAAAHSAACRHDVRLIAVDRWGYGDSAAPRAARTLEDYAKDIGELADSLSIDRFSLLGISGGGPFATVTAGCLGQRVARLALIAPVGPIAGEHDLHIDLTHQLCFRALPRIPPLISSLFQIYRGILRASPQLGARLAGARGPTADKTILRDPDIARALGNAFRHGLRDGTSGPVIDLSLFARPWPAFTLRCEARMWLGALDRNVPRTAALRMAHTYGIPVSEIDGAGHFWFAHNADAALNWLTAREHP